MPILHRIFLSTAESFRHKSAFPTFPSCEDHREALQLTVGRYARRIFDTHRRRLAIPSESSQLKNSSTVVQLVCLYFAVFLACAIGLQLWSGKLSTTAVNAVDYFSSGLLWTSSFVALLLALERLARPGNFLVWLGVSAACGALAIDEAFEFHEMSSVILGDDDYIKVLILIGAAVGLYVVYRLEAPATLVRNLFIAGLTIQCLYLAIDVGDGDFYQSPIPKHIADWIEEILELLFVQLYLFSLTVHHLNTR